MSPELQVALIAAASVIGAAVVAAIPALLTLQRRTTGAVAAEGTATREALDTIARALNTRIDDARDDAARVREWQAGHDAEHVLIGRQTPRGDT